MATGPVKKTHLRTDSDLRLEEDMRRYARLLEERTRARNGEATFSDGAMELIQEEYQTQPMDRSSSVDTMIYLVRGLRTIYAQDPVFTWVGDEKGMANPQATRINIYPAIAPRDPPRNPQAPDITVRCSVGGFPPSMIGNLAGFNMVDGTRIHAGIVPVGCQIEVSAKSPVTSMRIAEHIANSFRGMWRQWVKYRLFSIQDVAVVEGGARNNAPQVQAAQSDQQTITYVNMTVLRAWRTIDRPNSELHERANAFVTLEGEAPIKGQPPTGRMASDSSFAADDAEMGLASDRRPAILSVSEFVIGGDPPAITVTRTEAPVEDHD